MPSMRLRPTCLVAVAHLCGGHFIMGKRIEEAGNRYGKLVVVEYAGKDKYGRATWVCNCECGGEIIAKGGSLRSGSVQSCGCIRAE